MGDCSASTQGSSKAVLVSCRLNSFLPRKVRKGHHHEPGEPHRRERLSRELIGSRSQADRFLSRRAHQARSSRRNNPMDPTSRLVAGGRRDSPSFSIHPVAVIVSQAKDPAGRQCTRNTLRTTANECHPLSVEMVTRQFTNANHAPRGNITALLAVHHIKDATSDGSSIARFCGNANEPCTKNRLETLMYAGVTVSDRRMPVPCYPPAGRPAAGGRPAENLDT